MDTNTEKILNLLESSRELIVKLDDLLDKNPKNVSNVKKDGFEIIRKIDTLSLAFNIGLIFKNKVYVMNLVDLTFSSYKFTEEYNPILKEIYYNIYTKILEISKPNYLNYYEYVDKITDMDATEIFTLASLILLENKFRKYMIYQSTELIKSLKNKLGRSE